MTVHLSKISCGSSSLSVFDCKCRVFFVGLNSYKAYPMKPSKNHLYLTMLCILFGMLISCKAQYGCPSNGKNVGAERILSGEKVPKAPKFKA